MSVSVIVVTYNGKRWIEKCLTSLFGSEIPLEVIVVDNNSTDSTVSFIKSKFPQVTLIELKKNLGFGAANNIALKRVREEKRDFAFLLNQDAYIFPDTVQKLLEVAVKNKEYGILSPIHLDHTKKYLEPSFLHFVRKESSKSFLNDMIFKKELQQIYPFKMVNAAAWLLPLQTLETVGGFHPMFFLYGEDDNYCQRVLYHNLKIGVAPNIYVVHESENRSFTDYEKGSDPYFRKFMNDIKVRYGDVNSNVYQDFPKMKFYYLKRAVGDILNLRFTEFKINLYKAKLLSGLNFNDHIAEMQKKQPSYIN